MFKKTLLMTLISLAFSVSAESPKAPTSEAKSEEQSAVKPEKSVKVESKNTSGTSDTQDTTDAKSKSAENTQVKAPVKDVQASAKPTVEQVPPPKIDAAKLAYPKEKLSIAKSTAATYDSNIEFTEFTANDEKQTFYFDEYGQSVDKANDDGYYRNVLGKTKAGRIVAQDFYQKTKTPQTNAFLMVKDGDLKNFNTEVNDGLIVWFNPTGEATQAQRFDNGVAQGDTVFFSKGVVVAKKKDDELTVYNESLPVMYSEQTEEQKRAIFYRPDGSVVLSITKNKDGRKTQAWDKLGKSVLPSEVAEESQALMKISGQILRQL